MANKSKGVTKTGSKIIGGIGFDIPKSLGELRMKFDGLRDVAKKFDDGAHKTALMNKVEELYLEAGSWFNANKVVNAPAPGNA